MQTRIVTILAILALSAASTAASAAITTFCPNTASTADREYSVTTTPTASYLAYGDGNIGNGRNDAFLASQAGYTLIESDQANNSSGYLILSGIGAATGTFSIDRSLYLQYADLAIGFKSGANISPEYTIFGLGAGTTSGAWTISRNSLSHAVLYGHGTPPVTNVPVPGPLALVGIGFLGMGVTLRRRGATKV